MFSRSLSLRLSRPPSLCPCRFHSNFLLSCCTCVDLARNIENATGIHDSAYRGQDEGPYKVEAGFKGYHIKASAGWRRPAHRTTATLESCASKSSSLFGKLMPNSCGGTCWRVLHLPAWVGQQSQQLRRSVFLQHVSSFSQNRSVLPARLGWVHDSSRSELM